MVNKTLEKLERSELIQLIEIYSKNWLAMDGVWFQSVERKFGMAAPGLKVTLPNLADDKLVRKAIDEVK